MREYRLLNNNWKFTYGDKVGASPDEINRWQDIGIAALLWNSILYGKRILFGIWNLFQMV